MNIGWVASSTYAWPGSVSLDRVKAIGPVWSSWKAWRSCHSDNVICDDLGHAKTLLKRAFQSVCNFYLPRRLYQDLNRPQSVRWYDGDFKQQTNHIEDVIALHLSAQHNDIILLVGFDFSTCWSDGDPLQDHRSRNQLGLYRQIMIDNPELQWVVLDHDADLDKAFGSIDNLTKDSLQNVFNLLDNR